MITHTASESVYCSTKRRWFVSIRFENFRIGQSLSNRIESDDRFESNLETSQVPTYNVMIGLLTLSNDEIEH